MTKVPDNADKGGAAGDGEHDRAKPPKAVLAGAVALIGSVGALAGGAGVLFRAWRAVGSDRKDFWVAAVPGVATGAGTIILALVTVWISVRERKRDTWLRGQDAIAANAAVTAEVTRAEKQRAADAGERVRERDAQALRHAQREARKVVATLREAGTVVFLDVTNAGAETIMNVWVESAHTDAPDERGERHSWTPDTSKDDWQGQIFAPDSHVALLMPGRTWEIPGKLAKTLADGNLSPGTIYDSGPTLGGNLVISWEDASGRYWRSSGAGGLSEQTSAFAPDRQGTYRFYEPTRPE